MSHSLGLSHGWEEFVSDGWHSNTEGKVNSVIEGLGADNSSLFGEHLEATKAAGLLVIFNAFQELGINDNVAWQFLWVLTLESLDLGDHHLSVLADCLILDLLKEFNICLSKSDIDSWLDKFDQALYKDMVNYEGGL